MNSLDELFTISCGQMAEARCTVKHDPRATAKSEGGCHWDLLAGGWWFRLPDGSTRLTRDRELAEMIAERWAAKSQPELPLEL